MSRGTAIRVLVVDDSALMRKAIKAMLVDGPGPAFEVETARNGVDALEQVRARRPDVVTLDINMPEMDGLTCLAALMAECPVPVVMVSSLTEDGALTTLEALELGAVDYVLKPGGTVSLNIDDVRAELVEKVERAARARVRAAVPAPRHPAARPARPPRPTGSQGTGPQVTGPQVTELVLVGASTGGPPALTRLLRELPSGFRPPVVIAQHIAEAFARPLADRLAAVCPLPVTEVQGSVPLEPGHVYLGGSGSDLVLARGPRGLLVKAVPPSAAYRWHPSVDRLVESALRLLPAERLVGVLLTGMGDDGAAQLAELAARGGRTVAESGETTVVNGMPDELVRRGGATEVKPLPEIADVLLRWT